MSLSLLEDPCALEALRREALALLGPIGAARMLYARGFAEGALEALKQAGDFSRMDLGGTGSALACRPLILVPRADVRGRAAPRLHANRCSTEALARGPGQTPASGPSCFATAGYSSGWYSAWLNEPVILQETQCVSAGDRACRFEPHQAEASQDRAAGAWGTEILVDLDVGAILRWAREESALAEAGENVDASESLPGCDLTSPGIHLWGPVMGLPYAGAIDGELALEEIEADLGPGEIEVVVLDLTGAGTRGVETAGIARLLARFEEAELDVILAGLSPGSERALRASGIELPLVERDLGTAVAAAFRFARASRQNH